MKVGDKLDALKLGHSPIDVKGMMAKLGYILKGSIEPRQIPAEISLQIDTIKVSQKEYETVSLPQEAVYITCPYCSAYNSTYLRLEVISGAQFLVCGNCQSVMEVSDLGEK